MTVTGSSLINTSANGQPTDNEDRPFSFAMGTQIFINPSDDPTDAVVSFKLDPNLLAGSLSIPVFRSRNILFIHTQLSQITIFRFTIALDAIVGNHEGLSFGIQFCRQDRVNGMQRWQSNEGWTWR